MKEIKSFVPKGFTLIEFVVIISIFAIMAGIALINFAGFRSNVGSSTLAHDIALTIRQAQVFGWATQTELGNNGVGETIQLDSSGNPQRFADGVYFKYDSDTQRFSKDFILYVKGDATPSNEAYVDVLGTFDRTIDTIKIQGPNHISAIKYASNKNDLLLDSDKNIPLSGNQVGGSFSIAFSRPRPEAMFFEGSALLDPTATYTGIYVSNDADCPGSTPCTTAQHVVIISRFGEITVQ